MRHRQEKPFFEGPAHPSLARRALGEGVATAVLTMAVVFATQATWLGALRPLAICVGAPAAVAALTLSFGPVTGAHFNPLITASQWLRGHRNTGCFAAYICSQFVGALIGAALAGLLVAPAAPVAPAPIAVVIGSEIFATAGLIIIILAASLITGPFVGPLAVIGWLVMISLAAPGGPFANPVLALAAPLALRSMDPTLVLIHVAAQLAGAAIALMVVAVTYPRVAERVPGLSPSMARAPVEPL